MTLETFDSLCTKRVSFILATKDRPEFMDAALSNLGTLKGPRDEVIVVDASSDDISWRIAQSHAPLVDIYLASGVADMGTQYNMGALAARGRYVKWVTDDDHIYPKGMRSAIGFMEEHVETDVLQCGGVKIRDGRKTTDIPPENFGDEVRDPIIGSACLLGQVVRRRAFSVAGLLYPGILALDVEFLARCIHRGLAVRGCDICLYWHPLYEHSGTIAHRRRWREEMDAIAESYHLRLLANPLEELCVLA